MFSISPRSSRGPRPPRWATVSVTCTDGRMHELTDEEMAVSREAGSGTAICGAPVTPAPLVAAPGRRCVACAGVVWVPDAPAVAPLRPEVPRAGRRALAALLRTLTAATTGFAYGGGGGAR